MQTDWQPIETAPKDGSKVLLWFPERECAATGWWRDNCPGDPDPLDHDRKWVGNFSDGFEADARHTLGEPTHWMPLPEPPNAD